VKSYESRIFNKLLNKLKEIAIKSYTKMPFFKDLVSRRELSEEETTNQYDGIRILIIPRMYQWDRTLFMFISRALRDHY